jgi:hypothetical protein
MLKIEANTIVHWKSITLSFDSDGHFLCGYGQVIVEAESVMIKESCEWISWFYHEGKLNKYLGAWIPFERDRLPKKR